MPPASEGGKAGAVSALGKPGCCLWLHSLDRTAARRIPRQLTSASPGARSGPWPGGPGSVQRM
jgi:hypothetical protein